MLLKLVHAGDDGRAQAIQVVTANHFGCHSRKTWRTLRASVEARRGGKRLIRVALPGRISDGSGNASQNHCSTFWSRGTETNATSTLSV